MGKSILQDWRFLARFGRDRKGGPATEFAIIGSTFFLILCAIFTLSLDMYWQMALDTATRAATRQVQIGDIKSGPAFVAAVCAEFGPVAGSNCTGTLQYSVQSGAYFGTTTSGIIGAAGTLSSAGLTKNANFSSIAATAAGEPQFLLVQVSMPVPFVFMRGLSAVVAQNGTNYLYSAVATVVEP